MFFHEKYFDCRVIHVIVTLTLGVYPTCFSILCVPWKLNLMLSKINTQAYYAHLILFSLSLSFPSKFQCGLVCICTLLFFFPTWCSWGNTICYLYLLFIVTWFLVDHFTHKHICLSGCCSKRVKMFVIGILPVIRFKHPPYILCEFVDSKS